MRVPSSEMVPGMFNCVNFSSWGEDETKQYFRAEAPVDSLRDVIDNIVLYDGSSNSISE